MKGRMASHAQENAFLYLFLNTPPGPVPHLLDGRFFFARVQVVERERTLKSGMPTLDTLPTQQFSGSLYLLVG